MLTRFLNGPIAVKTRQWVSVERPRISTHGCRIFNIVGPRMPNLSAEKTRAGPKKYIFALMACICVVAVFDRANYTSWWTDV